MYLWNLSGIDELRGLIGVDTVQLRKRLRLAQLENGRLVYIQPLRVRKGWLTIGDDESFVIDCRQTGRPYGASDELRKIPDEILILVRGK
jgi:hypothetical protein